MSYRIKGASVSELLTCWTEAGYTNWVQIAAATLSGNSLRQTVHTHRVSVHQAAKLVATLLRVARVLRAWRKVMAATPPGLWLTSPASWLPRTGISSGTLGNRIWTIPLPFLSFKRPPVQGSPGAESVIHHVCSDLQLYSQSHQENPLQTVVVHAVTLRARQSSSA